MKGMFSLLASWAVVATSVLAQQPEWAQCGGIGWTGGTTCVTGTVCTVINAYYFQCLLPSSGVTTVTTPTGTTTTTTATSTATGTLPPRGSLQQMSNFGSNPTGVGMYVYVPTTLQAAPALIVAIHYCSGTAQAYFTGTPYKSLADQYGFIVIYPSSPHSGTCWDVSSQATLTHNGGGDSNAIANAARFAVSSWGVNPNKVFVTGTSSGAMMTNVMAATYPDLFKAATVYSGVPAGCFVSSTNGVNAWNSTCANGQTIDTPQQWANVVHAMYPGYTGAYPKIQEYHGTADTTLYPQNLQEEVKQWAGVFGYNVNAPTQVLQNTPLSGYTKSIYGPNLQGISGAGVGHTVPVQGTEDLKWFGLI